MPARKPTPKTKLTVIERRTLEQQNHVIEILEKIPIVSVACKRANISRATFYRWKEENLEFKARADKAIKEGDLVIGDLAESKLIENIHNGNMTALIFWLKSRNAKFMDKRHIIADVRNETLAPLHPAVEKRINDAFELFEKKAKEAEKEYVVMDDDD